MNDLPAMHILVLISIIGVPLVIIGMLTHATNNRNSFEGVRVGEFVGDWTWFDKKLYGFDSYEEYKADKLGMTLHDYLDSLQDNPIMFPIPGEDFGEEMASDIAEVFGTESSEDGM